MYDSFMSAMLCGLHFNLTLLLYHFLVVFIQAAEFDTPQTLMDRGGLFRDLVEAAGREGDMARA